jgi:hypothetical protein
MRIRYWKGLFSILIEHRGNELFSITGRNSELKKNYPVFSFFILLKFQIIYSLIQTFFLVSFSFLPFPNLLFLFLPHFPTLSLTYKSFNELFILLPSYITPNLSILLQSLTMAPSSTITKLHFYTHYNLVTL